MVGWDALLHTIQPLTCQLHCDKAVLNLKYLYNECLEFHEFFLIHLAFHHPSSLRQVIISPRNILVHPFIAISGRFLFNLSSLNFLLPNYELLSAFPYISSSCYPLSSCTFVGQSFSSSFFRFLCKIITTIMKA